MKDLKGRNALLTGGSRGLGPYIGRVLAREGVNLALAARSAEALDSVAKELAGLGVRTLAIPADLSDPSALQEVAEQARAEMQTIDILINNAGVEQLAPFAKLSPDLVENMIQTNLVAPMLLTRLLLPEMLERGSGHVVNISSLGAKKGSPYSATYAATKAALIEWTSSIREEMRGTGVGASVVCPGFVSEAGMFAVQGRRAPWLMGETTPEAVAAAVLRAIRRDIEEIIVNPGPVKLMLIVDAISSTVGSWLLRASGVYEFFRQGAEEFEAQTRPGGGEEEPPDGNEGLPTEPERFC